MSCFGRFGRGSMRPLQILTSILSDWRGRKPGSNKPPAPCRLSATAFVNRLKDAIANVTLGRGPGNFPGVGFVPAGGTYRERENVDALKVLGIEASATWTHGWWLVQAGASWTHARMVA